MLPADGKTALEGFEAEAEVRQTTIQELHRSLLRGQHVYLKGLCRKIRIFTIGQITNKTQNRTTNGEHKQGGSEKEIYAPEEGADTGLFASVLQVLSFILVLQVFCCSFLSFSHILALYFVKW